MEMLLNCFQIQFDIFGSINGEFGDGKGQDALNPILVQLAV